jgi:Flp pilus assembly protein TadB
MARRALMRASDADREHVAERLRNATAEGRLLAEELEERLGAAFSARTYGELDSLVADLPRPDHGRRRSDAVRLRHALVLAVAIPLAIAIVAAVVFVVTGLVTMWMVWLALCWWCLGHRRRTYRARRRRGYQVRSGVYDFRRL